jgi:hypothetical protein
MRWLKSLFARRKTVEEINLDNGYICKGVTVAPVNRSYQSGIPGGGRRVQPITPAEIIARKLELMPDEALFR